VLGTSTEDIFGGSNFTAKQILLGKEKGYEKSEF